MKKFIAMLFLIFACGTASAGFNGLTHHSRANCVNNETISWDFTKAWSLSVSSRHYHQPYKPGDFADHWGNPPAAKTKRLAAVCWGEGHGDWIVDGWHYILKNDGTYELAQYDEKVKDCSIYNGWWDFDGK